MGVLTSPRIIVIAPRSGVFLINNAARRAVLGTAFSCKRSLIEGQKTRKKG